MDYLNFLYASLGIGFLVLVGFVSYAFYNLSRILTKVDDITKDVNDFKERGQKVISDLQNKAKELTATGKEKVKEVKKDIKAKL